MKKLMLFMFVIVLLVGTVSAWEWDNVKNYDEETKTVTVVNALGLGEDIATVQLKSPIKKYMVSASDNFFEIEIDNFGLYSDIISKMEYYKLKNDVIGNEMQKNNYWMFYDVNKEKTIVSYEDVCDGFFGNGTKNCYEKVTETIGKGDWVMFDNAKVLPIGKVKLRNYIEIAEYEWVEYVPTFYGVEVSEWAGVGNDGFTTLLMHLDSNFLDVAIGNTSTHTFTASGGANIDTSIKMFGAGSLNCSSAGSDFVQQDEQDSDDLGVPSAGANWTLDFWLYPSQGSATDDIVNVHGLDTSNADIRVTLMADETIRVIINGDDTLQSNTSAPIGDWSHVAIVRQTQVLRIWQDGVLTATRASVRSTAGGTGRKFVFCSITDGAFSEFLDGNIDEMRFSKGIGRFLDDFTPATAAYGQATTINIFSPTNSTFSDSTIFFNASATNTIDTWTVNYNGTNVTISENSSLTVEDGTFQLLMYGNDTDGDFGLNDTIFFGVDSIAPTINVTSPFGIITFKDGTENQTLNFNASDIHLDACVFEYDGSNTTTNCATNTTNFTISDPRNLTFYVNDTAGNTVSQFVDWSYLVLQTSSSFNATTFETAQETFIVNVTTNGTAPTNTNLIYDGTTFSSATVTNPESDNYTLARTIDIPLTNETKSWFFNFTIGNTAINSSTQNQIVGLTNFSFCNNETSYINITFVNETIAEESVTSQIDTDWNFWLGSGSIFKTLSFTNTTENSQYDFCLTGVNRTLETNVTITYDNSESEQRSLSSPFTLTNTTTDLVLFLLPTADGVFVTFQTVTVAEQVIADVTANVTKGGNLISTGMTDDAGLVQYFLDPDTTYVFSFFKTGFGVVTTTLKPTQSSFTIIMGGAIVAVQNDTTKGISYTTRPLNNVLPNNTAFSFNLSFSSVFWGLDSFGFTLKNSTGTIFNTTTSTTETGGFLSRILDTGNNTDIQMEIFWTIGGNQTNVTRLWKVLDTSDEGFSIKTFFDDLSIYLTSGLFGLTSFGLGIIIFMIILITTGVLSIKFGITNPAGISIIVFAMVLFFDVGLGIMPNPIGAVDNFPTIFIGLVFLGLLLKEAIIR